MKGLNYQIGGCMLNKLNKKWWKLLYECGIAELNCGIFPTDESVKITFADGSICRFNYAIYVKDEKTGEILVLTEHCGYFIFKHCDVNVLGRLNEKIK